MDTQCPSRWTLAPGSGLLCDRPDGHDRHHYDYEEGVWWYSDDEPDDVIDPFA